MFSVAARSTFFLGGMVIDGEEMGWMEFLSYGSRYRTLVAEIRFET